MNFKKTFTIIPLSWFYTLVVVVILQSFFLAPLEQSYKKINRSRSVYAESLRYLDPDSVPSLESNSEVFGSARSLFLIFIAVCAIGLSFAAIWWLVGIFFPNENHGNFMLLVLFSNILFWGIFLGERNFVSTPLGEGLMRLFEPIF